MSPRKAFLRSVIGKPYAPGAQGPDAFDCYGLARVALRELYGRELPDRADPADRRAWRRAPVAVEGAIVLMGAGAVDKHIGLYVAGGLLHAIEGLGVIHDDLLSLRFRGICNLRIYVPA